MSIYHIYHEYTVTQFFGRTTGVRQAFIRKIKRSNSHVIQLTPPIVVFSEPKEALARNY